MDKIFEILANFNFAKVGDQEEFQIDVDQMILKDGFWNSFITKSVAVPKPEIVSLFHILQYKNTWQR